MRTLNISMQAAKNLLHRRNLILAGSALVLGLLTAGTQAKADRVHFRYAGGRWSHSYHSGWHRYWGGPSIGFYYAPAPVYLVPGYDAPTYYSGPDFWYSNPSFGLNLNLGGGGYSGGYYGGRSVHYGNRYYHSGGFRPGNSGHYYGGSSRPGNSGHSYGGSFHSGNSGHSYGGRSAGDRQRR